jgi:hypothetical protein
MAHEMPPAGQMKDYKELIHQCVDRKQIHCPIFPDNIKVTINELSDSGLLQ